MPRGIYGSGDPAKARRNLRYRKKKNPDARNGSAARGRKPLLPAERYRRRRAARRKASIRWNKNNANYLSQRKAELCFRFGAKSEKEREAEREFWTRALRAIRAVDLVCPVFIWEDEHGERHREYLETPERMERRLAAAQRKRAA
jgi:hypothetical protein